MRREPGGSVSGRGGTRALRPAVAEVGPQEVAVLDRLARPLHAADDGAGQRLLGAYLSDGASDAETYRGFMDRFREAFTAETSAFVDVVRGERANPCSPQDARAALAAAIACEVSAREGRVVGIAEIG